LTAGESEGARPSRLPTSTSAWELIGAVLGRGTFIVGPSPRDPDGEALVLVPPGVKIPEPADAEEPISSQEWRVALWSADENGDRFVDVERPQSVSVVSLAYVIGLLELKCPEYLEWVADLLERRLLNACIVAMPDADGYVLPAAARWRRDAEAMLDEIDIAMSHAPTLEERRAGGIPAELLKEVVTDSPHPEQYEPRLAPGWLRNLYEERSREAMAHDHDAHR
jgi:hypothetical protein